MLDGEKPGRKRYRYSILVISTRFSTRPLCERRLRCNSRTRDVTRVQVAHSIDAMR
jgi:hypothetical protein